MAAQSQSVAELETASAGEERRGQGVGDCKSFVRKIWSIPDDPSVKEDQELFVKKTFKELLIYMGFLILVCIIAFGMTSTNMYYYTKVMMDLFLDSQSAKGVSFRKITTVADFWDFAEGPLLDGLYWEKWYNGKDLPDSSYGFIYYENKLLGVPQLRQLRVKKDSCEVNEEFKGYISECYAMFDESLQDTSPFGRYKQDSQEIAWFYQTPEKLDSHFYWGKIHLYTGGGYAKELDLSKTVSAKIMKYLKNNLWIRHGSRAVFISFTVYNANINLFCVVTMAVEFPATGGATPSWSFYTVKLLRYVNTLDYFVMFCEILFAIYVFYYLIEELIEICYVGLPYFLDIWNLLDILLILVAIIYFIFNLMRTNAVNEKLKILLANKTKFTNFEHLGFWETRFNNAVAIMVFFAWVKVFKYISFNKTMTQLSTTLSRCAKDLLGFFIMFFIVFLAFTQLGYLLFGTQVDDFSTFVNSFFTLFRIILGDFDFHQLEQANRILGPVFFILFVFFVFFVLINMFLAIINDTYSEVKSDMAKQTDLFIMSDYLKQSYNRIWERFAPNKDKLDAYERVLSKGVSDKKLTFSEWSAELQQEGFTVEELDAVFVKYDIDGSRVLDKAEQKKMLEELHKQKAMLETKEARRKGAGLGEDEDDDESSRSNEYIQVDEFMTLLRRVDRMETTMGAVVSNIDIVLAQLVDIKK